MGEGEPAPAPAADIKIFISGNSGSKEITNSQHRITMILKSLGIPLKQVDISAPGTEEQRDVMRAGAKKKEGQRYPLPPQIFNGDKYCGDYDDFDVANEDDELEEFLGIPRKTPKAVPAEEKKEEDAEKLPATEGAPTDAAPADVPATDSTEAPAAEAPPSEEAPVDETAAA
eukprot:TRINITY_DN8178_c0_g1_i3.p1 TRINITY_DN8178_c0_g1~~TRINITY_DN8178_c0_g1_i3.p1  ORF type:complete len:191 (+),score=85.52 TRINITY_DN8178_c0_g1_i3:58-573(+)